MSDKDKQLVPAPSQQVVWTAQDDKKLDRHKSLADQATVSGFVGVVFGGLSTVVAIMAAIHGAPVDGGLCSLGLGAGTFFSGRMCWWGVAGGNALAERKTAFERQKNEQKKIAAETRRKSIRDAAEAQMKSELANGPVLRTTRVAFDFDDREANSTSLILVIEPAWEERDRRQGADSAPVAVYYAQVLQQLSGGAEHDLNLRISCPAPPPAQGASPLLIAGQSPIPLPRLESPRRPLPEPAAIPPRPGRDAVPPRAPSTVSQQENPFRRMI